MRKLIVILFITLAQIQMFGQGFNHVWLLGNYTSLTGNKGRMTIDANSYSIVTEYRKMPFNGTQGNISDANGNLLMSSNGVWIANALNDTMLNGSGINPNGVTSNWPNGLPFFANNVFLPYPGDSMKYALYHHTGTANGYCLELYYSLIDISLDSGRGEVISKNNIIINDTLNGGIGACRHANGRDWWIVMLENESDAIYINLLTSNGVNLVNTQYLGYTPYPKGSISQLSFNNEGSKFIASTYDNPTNRNSYLVLADFNRCTGIFSNTQTVQLASGSYLWGLAFSPSGNYAYVCTEGNIFQVNVTTLTVDTVATYDGFISPGPTCCGSTFFNMYQASNGKIYVTSPSSVRHFTEINYPDSAGVACNVQQHAVFIGNYAHLSAVPNHPNYYLGCDTTQTGCPCLTGINDLQTPDFKLRVYPNPVVNGFLNIGYLLPQNKSGIFEIIDVTGNVVFKYRLPPWSNEQSFVLPNLSNGVYNGVITSNGKRVSKRWR